MKRDIRCRECALNTKADIKRYGSAKGMFRCDLCNKELPKEIVVCALTWVSAGESIDQIAPWWDEFIVIAK